MFKRVGRRLLSLHSGRWLTALVAAVVVLGAVAFSSAQPPTASAQCFGCFGNGFGFNNGFGFGNGFGFNNGVGFGNNWWGNNGWGNNWWGGNNLYPVGGSYVNNLYGYGLNNYGYGGYGLNNAYGLYGGYSPGIVYTTTPGTSVNLQYSAAPWPHTYTVSGKYCTDKTNGQVWVPTGAPTDGLKC